MEQYIGLIPLLPLLGFVCIGLFNKRLAPGLASLIACGTVLGSFILSLVFFSLINNNPQYVFQHKYFTWFAVGSLSLDMGFLIDSLSSLMLMIITGVGFLIHIYSTGYMKGDDGYSRFFAYLNLFIFFMLLLVLGSNYVVMFVGWEGVGLCSYLLIGFWFKVTSYNQAANKAFIMNRIGDLGFLLGMFLMFNTFGSLNFTDIYASAPSFTSNAPVLVAITLLLFVGATGKSAQIPLYTWLPDAMAGPTPVSALIHAATMVTAGIYMVCRSNILFSLAPYTQHIILIIGIATALLAATIGILQNDIKKVLAYSTVSQLGFMFAALGVGAYSTAMFHLTTHAFFKALLFLGAGSVIHALHGEQDIRKMGGLKGKIHLTFMIFLAGTLAIAGIPPFSGFFSKDEILAKVYEHSPMGYAILVFTAVLTAFYMFRLLYLTFYGNFRGTKEQESHIHESPASMTVPLIILAILSIFGGFIGLPHLFGGSHWFAGFLEPVFASSLSIQEGIELSVQTEYTLMGVMLGLLAVTILYARNKYLSRKEVPAEDSAITGVSEVVYNKYYVDEIYQGIIVKPLLAIGSFFTEIVEVYIIDGLVNFTGRATTEISRNLRLLQTGNVGFYIFSMVLGIIMMLLVWGLR